MRMLYVVLALCLVSSSAAAMPFASFVAVNGDVLEAKIMCEQDGRCFQLGRRPPVARWVYGEDAFYGPGPYVGPGYYGRPARHWAWWGFLGF